MKELVYKLLEKIVDNDAFGAGVIIIILLVFVGFTVHDVNSSYTEKLKIAAQYSLVECRDHVSSITLWKHECVVTTEQ